MTKKRFVSQAPMLARTVLLVFSTVPSMALAQAEHIARCRAIDDATQRLACYDAIASPARSESAGRTRDEARALSELPSEGSAAGSSVLRFGLPSQASPSTEISAISSRVRGRIEGWQRNTIFLLDNGQQWQVVDGSHCVCPAENATIHVTRGLFGAYWLSIDGYNRTASVKRIR